MTIKNGWYISPRTSTTEPQPYRELNTAFLPFDISYDAEQELYHYKEYRFNVPVDYEIPRETIIHIASVLLERAEMNKKTLSQFNALAETIRQESEKYPELIKFISEGEE